MKGVKRLLQYECYVLTVSQLRGGIKIIARQYESLLDTNGNEGRIRYGSSVRQQPIRQDLACFSPLSFFPFSDQFRLET